MSIDKLFQMDHNVPSLTERSSSDLIIPKKITLFSLDILKPIKGPIKLLKLFPEQCRC